MKSAFTHSIDDDLAQHGIHRIDDGPLRSRTRTTGDVRLLRLSGNTSELSINTTVPYPEHSVLAFVESPTPWASLEGERWVESQAALIVAPRGVDRRVRWAGPMHMLSAIVPRAAIASYGVSVTTGASLYTERRLLDSSVQRFLAGLLDTDASASAIEQYAIEQLVMEMTAALVLDRIGSVAGQGTPHEILRERAIAVIAQQCGDASLNSTRVAREVQSSLRQLQLVFAEAGNSIASEIRRQRARLAHSLLMDSRYDVLSIDQIAQRAGFHSPMSLRRAFNSTYSCTPRELRSARLAQRP